MFGELPKIFDRSFIIGYLLPSASCLVFSLGIIHRRDLLNPTDMSGNLSEGVAFLIFAFVLGVVLLAANRPITRFLEGYGRLNPVRILAPLQRVRFRRLQKTLSDAYRDDGDANAVASDEVRALRRRLSVRLAEYFPDDERLLLPSRFGNAVRAFESYPRAMYGLDIIEGWTRLVAAIPEKYLRKVDTAKAEADLWLNVWFLGVLTIPDAIAAWYWPDLVSNATRTGAAGMVSAPLSLWFLTGTIVAAVTVALFASRMATNAAVEWGSMVKAATDVFLPALYDKLGFDGGSGNEAARRRWGAFSQAITFRRPDVMPERNWGRSVVPERLAAEEDTKSGPKGAP
jgi:hypothetical protein